MMKQISVIKIYGGLGNQLFQYAFAKAYKLKNNCKVLLDYQTGFKNDKYKRQYLLHQFSIKIHEPKEFFFRIYKLKYFRILIKILFKSIFIYQKPPFRKFKSDYLFNHQKKIKFFQGYWQSPLYFNEFSKSIKKDLKINAKIKHSTSKESKLIKKNSIALCFRFFQEVKNLEKNFIKKEIIYYKKAINLIKKKIKNPQFFVFCNDVKFAKKFIKLNFPTLVNIYFFSEKPKNIDAVQDLFLLTKFENFILSKSTLHWWGAYLSKNLKVCIGNSDLGKDYFESNWIMV